MRPRRRSRGSLCPRLSALGVPSEPFKLRPFKDGSELHLVRPRPVVLVAAVVVLVAAVVDGLAGGGSFGVDGARRGRTVLHRAGKDCGPARRRCRGARIARRLGRAPSTISRELQRNAAIGRGRVEYRASTAQRHAERRAQRPKPAKLAVNPDLRVAFGSQFKGRDLMFEPRPRPAQSPSTNPTASGVGQLADRAGR